jgi:hypothetical protein
VVLVVWFLAGALLLVFEPSLFRNHIASVVPPLALLLALHPPPRLWAVALVVVLIPWWVVHLDDVLWPGGYDGADARVVAALRELPDGAQAISDEPGLVWRAGLHTPRQLNDASIKRIEEGMITTDTVAAAAAEPEVCAVVVWSNRYGRELPGLPAALEAAGYERAETYGGVRKLWLKRPCTVGRR